MTHEDAERRASRIHRWQMTEDEMTALTNEYVLAMIVHASEEECKLGTGGWVSPESNPEGHDVSHFINELLDLGYIERMASGSSFVRPTDAGKQVVAPGRPQ